MNAIHEQFKASYEPVPWTGCWLWTGALTDRGYGRMPSSNLRAHRVSWELHRGTIPAGMSVLHRCDVRCCVNPSHLFLGSQADNIADAVAKGRHIRGEMVGSSKLTEAQVLEIRQLYSTGCFTQLTLGKRFGISDRTVGEITRREIWRHC